MPVANQVIQETISKYRGDRARLMDILLDIQSIQGFIDPETRDKIARSLGLSVAEVKQTLSFYHFFHGEFKGKYTIYLNNSVISCMMGREKVARAFEEAAGCRFGKVTEDGLIGLFETACIGMSDQEPAALINGKVFTDLTTFRAREIIRDMKAGKEVEEMFGNTYGGGQNASPLIRSLVRNHIRRTGPITDPEYQPGQIIKSKICLMTPDDVITEVKKSNLRGRGGAGFPTGLKWQFCRQAKGEKKFIFCNADEGEPGTFKDRVILTEKPEMVFEGMIIAAFAIGAQEGILYLRYEYKYLEQYLNNVLEQMRKKKLLGLYICGKKDFNFDIRIQFGAGAYVCGEESALIESAEGKRGEPRNRPPFPVEKGYLGFPTVVNNVETLCSAVKILQNGCEWYFSLGTRESTGTKVLSVSGDCRYPGIYELEWGFSMKDILEMTGAEDTQAVQVGGPSGTLIGPDEYERILCYSDLATGGSFIIFNSSRKLIKDVVLKFTEFFIEESCGSCVPCRNIPTLLKQKLQKILTGKGTLEDIREIKEWGKIMDINRCGLGHTAARPVLTSLKNFEHLYLEKIQKTDQFESGFDLAEAVADSCEFVDRIPQI